ncbi:MAG: MFS transporter, partial [bacterium]|nr:MFS transporter [bacterium]
KELLAVCFSFILIFAFNSIDNAIAPLVNPIGSFFGVSEEKALWFISVCTGGTVTALIFGPAVLQYVKARTLLFWTLIVLAASQVLFALCPNFAGAMVFRFLSGAAAGLVATIMWQLTFHGVSKRSFPAMIAVLMSARPLATAIGVPLAGLLAWDTFWQLPIWIIAGLTAASGLLLYIFYPPESSDSAGGKKDEPQKKGIISPYVSALSVPYALPYYIGSTINRMAYFGFYSFCGIWFFQHYQLNIRDISYALLVIGLSEALINFTTGKIIAKCGHKATFLVSIILSGVLLPIFIYGGLPLKAAVAAISVFMLLDRVYSMALVISIPKMFPSTGDKTAFGSLNTLTAWGAMTVISWFQGQFLGAWGMKAMETCIVICFFAGLCALFWIQKKTIFDREVSAEPGVSSSSNNGTASQDGEAAISEQAETDSQNDGNLSGQGKAAEPDVSRSTDAETSDQK